MPIQLQWFDAQQTILYYTFETPWTWAEFAKIDAPTWEFIARSDDRIDMIIDYSNVERFPIGIKDIMNIAGENTTTDREGLVISVGGPVYIKILFTVFKRVYPQSVKPYRQVNTLDEAVALIEAERGDPITRLLAPFKQRH